MAACFTEGEEFRPAGGVDHHQLTRQRVELFGHVTGLSGEEVSGEDLCAVGTEVVLVHDLGEGNHVTHIEFGVVMDTFGARSRLTARTSVSRKRDQRWKAVTKDDFPAPAVPTTKTTGGVLESPPAMLHRRC